MSRLICFFLLFLPLAFGAGPIFAQEGISDPRPKGYFGVGHMEHHQHYQGLKNKHGSSCCSADTGECRPTQGRWAGDHWQIMVDGVWQDVDDAHTLDQAFLQSKGRDRWDEQAHVCASPTFEKDGTHYVFCAIPPDGGG